MGMVEVAGSILSHAMTRVEVSAQNLANLTTPGYKARKPFSLQVVGDTNNSLVNPKSTPAAIDFSSAPLRNTGNPLDVAISGAGFFVLRSQDGTFYTRSGQFARAADGRLTSPEGLIVQSTSGELVVGANDVKILNDGTVLDGDAPIGRLAVVSFADTSVLRPVGAGLFSAPEDAGQPVSAELHQGMLETSNVSTADEMVSIMAALRSAQSGQRVVQVYDDLMGRAVSAFGQQ